MPRWLRVQENASGEWSVSDLVRGYRVCAYNEEVHDGVHIHFPIHGGRVRPTSVALRREAEAVVLRYARAREWFEWDRFEECVKRWRSGSNSD